MTDEVLKFIERAKNDKELFDLVIKRGIFYACFENPSFEFPDVYNKYKKLYPWFDPSFDAPATLTDRTFVLRVSPQDVKKNLQYPQDMFAKMGNEAPPHCFESTDHYWIEPIPGLRIHYSNFISGLEGDVYCYNITIGRKLEAPYRSMSWTQELRFKKFKDGDISCRMINRNYIQHTLTQDLKNESAMFVVDLIEGLFKGEFFELTG